MILSLRDSDIPTRSGSITCRVDIMMQVLVGLSMLIVSILYSIGYKVILVVVTYIIIVRIILL